MAQCFRFNYRRVLLDVAYDIFVRLASGFRSMFNRERSLPSLRLARILLFSNIRKMNKEQYMALSISTQHPCTPDTSALFGMH